MKIVRIGMFLLLSDFKLFTLKILDTGRLYAIAECIHIYLIFEVLPKPFSLDLDLIVYLSLY